MIVLSIEITLVSHKTQSYHKSYLHFLLYPLFYKQSRHCFECAAVITEVFVTSKADLKLIQFFSDLDSSLVSGCQGSPVGHTMEVPNEKRTSAFSLARAKQSC